jgi:CubicO group peptidase (beta-lactamase class C family)
MVPQTNSRPSMALACDDQDDRFVRAFAILAEGIRQHAFPGAALAVLYRGQLVAHKALGRHTYEPTSPVIEATTVYDLASVTKVVATTAAAMILFERGLLDLNMPVREVLPQFDQKGDRHRANVTTRMLLSHSSGLPGYVRLFEQARGRNAMLEAACSLPLAADPSSRAEYSDIGFMILGEILERVAGESLDRFCRREVFVPLGMAHTGFCPPAQWRQNIPPTEDDRTFRRRIVQGEVEDENASAMGGIAGHAGLFAPALDVSLLAGCMLRSGDPIFKPETVELFTRRESSPAGTSHTLGWDTPSAPSQSGRYFSPGSFGHLGYAGTSLWADPRRQLSVTLLTNRTWPDRQSQLIRKIRPAFHDAIVEALPNVG